MANTLMQRDSQIDLPEPGSQGVVSELLYGRRNFNARLAKAMAVRFGCAVFVKIKIQYAAFSLHGITCSSRMRDCKTAPRKVRFVRKI